MSTISEAIARELMQIRRQLEPVVKLSRRDMRKQFARLVRRGCTETQALAIMSDSATWFTRPLVEPENTMAH